MNKVSINFETLFEILRLEKRREELQELPDAFYENVKEYITEKKKILQIAKTNLFSEEEINKTEKQLSNIYKILDELYNRRETKIVNLAMMKSKSETNSALHFPLSKEEMPFFNQLKEIFVEQKKTILGRFKKEPSEVLKKTHLKTSTTNLPLNSTPTTITNNEHNSELKKVKITLTSDVPKFLGKDREIYGPYQKGQSIELSKDIANLLIKRNFAVYEQN
jgi:DNA replication initiation complex subunit (GINS family)